MAASDREHETGAGGTAAIGDELAEAIRRQVEAVAQSVRGELARIQDEAVARSRVAAEGAAYLGAAGALGLIAAGAVATLPLIALRKVLPPSLIALGLAAGAGTGAAVLVRRGLERLKEAAPEPIEQRLDQATSSVAETLKDEARRVRPV
jgi:hypothetical protein